jgi:chemotaxis signal transduction protein
LAGAVFPAADGEVSTETVSGSELAPELECTAAALPAEDRAEGVVPLEEPDLAQPGAESVAQMEEEEQRATAILPPPSPEFASLEASLPAFPAAAAPWPARSASEEPASDEDDFELVDAEQAERMLDRLIDAARSVIRSSLPAMQATSAGAEAPRAQQEPPALSAPPGAPVPEQPAPARRELAEEGRGDVSPIPPAAALMALGLPERLRTRLESIGDLDQLLKSRSALAPAPEQGPRLLVFRAGGEYYGLHMEHVREVERVGRVTAVPGAPAFVKGLVNLRGEILPLPDLGALLGHAAAPEAAGRLVVAQAAPDEPPVALLVEELNGLAPLREESVAPAPRPGISRGAIEHRGRRVTWLEPAPVFGAEALERAAQPAARS